MKTVAKSEPVLSAAQQIVDVLRQPGAVALVPTETVYGLVCRAADTAAVEKIRQLKHRNAGKFFGWFVKDCTAPEKYGLVFSDAAFRLAEKYFPGALTLVVSKVDGTTQAVRVADHPLIQAVENIIDEPLVQTSANASGMPDALSLEQALEQLVGEPDIACDGGALASDASGSTVVDTVKNPPAILRQGKLFVEL